MVQLSEAVARYHNLLEHDRYRDLAWAEELQEHMRSSGLSESGRLLTSVLRPHFISRTQLDNLSRASAQLSAILDQVETLALESPPLLNRLRLLPAEKMLASIPCGPSRLNVALQMDAAVQNGSLSLRGLEACKPAGIGYADPLADIFLDLPLVQEFKRGYCKLSKLGGPKPLFSALLRTWKDFGGQRRPNLAIVELGQQNNGHSGENPLIARSLSQAGSPVRLLSPDQLEYRNGRLVAADFEIDLVLRRVGTRELLTRSNLDHPLLRAYRDRAVCIVNDFRSEIAQSRALFDLITDEAVTAALPATDRKLIRTFVPWTRVVAQRNTTYKDEQVDLPDFIRRFRERFVLRPNDDSQSGAIYIGSEMTQPAWEQAIQVALRTPYVVQEHAHPAREIFPVFQYGSLEWKQAEVAVRPHVLNGKMQGFVAGLETCSGATRRPLAAAPVLVVEDM